MSTPTTPTPPARSETVRERATRQLATAIFAFVACAAITACGGGSESNAEMGKAAGAQTTSEASTNASRSMPSASESLQYQKKVLA